MNHIIDGIILFLIILILAVSPDIRLSMVKRISMSRFIKKVFIKLKKDNQNIYVLGTINDEHISNTKYSLVHLDGVIRKLKPDILLVESKNKEIEEDNLADGSIEMLFSSLTAKELNIPIKGFDWWNDKEIKHGQLVDQRKKHIVKNIVDRSRNYNNVLVLVEYSQIKELISEMKKVSYSTTNIDNTERDKLFEPKMEKLSFPIGTKYYLQKRIEIEENSLYSSKSEEWRKAYNDSIQAKKKLLKKIDEIGERVAP